MGGQRSAFAVDAAALRRPGAVRIVGAQRVRRLAESVRAGVEPARVNLDLHAARIIRSAAALDERGGAAARVDAAELLAAAAVCAGELVADPPLRHRVRVAGDRPVHRATRPTITNGPTITSSSLWRSSQRIVGESTARPALPKQGRPRTLLQVYPRGRGGEGDRQACSRAHREATDRTASPG